MFEIGNEHGARAWSREPGAKGKELRAKGKENPFRLSSGGVQRGLRNTYFHWDSWQLVIEY